MPYPGRVWSTRPRQRIPMLAHLTRLAVTALVTAGAAAALTSDALLVGPNRPYATIQSAILASSPGDVVLIDPGTYVEELDVDRGVVLLARGQPTTLDGRLAIRGIPAGQTVVVSGVSVLPSTSLPSGDGCSVVAAVTATLSRGPLRFQDLRVQGTAGQGLCGLEAGRGGDAVSLERCFDVVFESVELTGGPGQDGQALGPAPGSGGIGLLAREGTTVDLSRAIVRGARGRDSSTVAGRGGGACGLLAGSRGFAYSTSIEGGAGGDSADLSPGSGGEGLFVSAGSNAWIQQTTTLGGDGGASLAGSGFDGPGQAGQGIVHMLPGTPRQLDAPGFVQNAPWQATVLQLEAGETIRLINGARPGLRFAPAFERPLQVLWPAADSSIAAPLVSTAGGSLALPMGPMVPPAGEDAVSFLLQAFAQSPTGSLRFSGSRLVVALSPGL